MALKDRFRRAIGRDDKSDRASISSGSTGKNTNGTTTPTGHETTNPLTMTQTAVDDHHQKPAITITKTHSRLAKSLTWNSSSSGGDKKSKQEIQKDKQLQKWAKSDDVEWTSPMDRRPGKKDQQCQNTLRAFDLRKAELNGRSQSICSGVSPSQSRNNSIDEGVSLSTINAKRNSVGPGKLSQEVQV